MGSYDDWDRLTPQQKAARYRPVTMNIWLRSALEKLSPSSVFDLAGIQPDPWQVQVMSPTDVRTTLVLCTRQAGKSTTMGARAVKQARDFPGSTTLLLAPSLRQSAELMRRTADIYLPQKHLAPAKAVNALSIVLENKSRIFALPGSEDTVRGYTADLLLLDEAAMIQDELYYTVRPMVAVSGGQIIAATTAKGKRGWFYEDWIKESTDRKITVTADDVHRIPRDFLAEEREKLGEAWFMQEYYCQFNDVVDSLFTTDQLDEITTDLVKPLFGGGEGYDGEEGISPLEW